MKGFAFIYLFFYLATGNPINKNNVTTLNNKTICFIASIYTTKIWKFQDLTQGQVIDKDRELYLKQRPTEFYQCTQVLGSEQIEELKEMESRIIKANGFPSATEIASKEGWRKERSNAI